MRFNAFEDECTKVGTMGGCGIKCPIYLEGECEYSKEVLGKLTDESEIAEHLEIYNL